MADQLATLNRILTLKNFGFSLQEIAEVLRDGSSPMHIERVLRRKVEEAHQAISHEQLRIARVEAWLSQIQEDEMPKYDVLLKTLEPQLVASIRERCDQVARTGEMFAELGEYIESQGAKGTGPGTTLYHNTESAEEGIDAEVTFAISSPIAETERVRVYHLPLVEKAACLVYKGTDENFGEASNAIATWIEENGYHICGPNRLVFLECGETEGGWVVETQFPVEKG